MLVVTDIHYLNVLETMSRYKIYNHLIDTDLFGINARRKPKKKHENRHKKSIQRFKKNK